MVITAFIIDEARRLLKSTCLTNEEVRKQLGLELYEMAAITNSISQDIPAAALAVLISHIDNSYKVEEIDYWLDGKGRRCIMSNRTGCTGTVNVENPIQLPGLEEFFGQPAYPCSVCGRLHRLDGMHPVAIFVCRTNAAYLFNGTIKEEEEFNRID